MLGAALAIGHRIVWVVAGAVRQDPKAEPVAVALSHGRCTVAVIAFVVAHKHHAAAQLLLAVASLASCRALAPTEVVGVAGEAAKKEGFGIRSLRQMGYR